MDAISLVEATDKDRVEYGLPLGEAYSIRRKEKQGTQLGFIFHPFDSKRWRFKATGVKGVEYLTGDQFISIGQELKRLNQEVK